MKNKHSYAGHSKVLEIQLHIDISCQHRIHHSYTSQHMTGTCQHHDQLPCRLSVLVVVAVAASVVVVASSALVLLVAVLVPAAAVVVAVFVVVVAAVASAAVVVSAAAAVVLVAVDGFASVVVSVLAADVVGLQKM